MIDLFTGDELDGTLGIDLFTGEETNMLPNIPRYHAEKSIYLYCTLEREAARNIVNTGFYNVPMSLYETPYIASMMAKNIQNPVTLRIIVDLNINNGEFYYDQLTTFDNILKEKYKFKSIEEYKSKCEYTRCLVIEPKTKAKIIEYTINKASKLIINPQYIK